MLDLDATIFLSRREKYPQKIWQEAATGRMLLRKEGLFFTVNTLIRARTQHACLACCVPLIYFGADMAFW